MANSYSYVFDSLTRIGDDNCSIGEREVQNQNFSNYPLKSFFAQDCGMTRPVAFATKQPNVFPTGTPTGMQTHRGALCYNVTDGELWYYDHT